MTKKIEIEQFLSSLDSTMYGKWIISKPVGDEFHDGETIIRHLYLWPDLRWRLTAWKTDENHAYYNTEEEAEQVLEKANAK